jgi:hypothetical protein
MVALADRQKTVDDADLQALVARVRAPEVVAPAVAPRKPARAASRPLVAEPPVERGYGHGV